MVYSDGIYHPPIAELARAGNFKAIAHWLNRSLAPYGIRVYVGSTKPGCLKVLVELPDLEQRDLPDQWREYLIRFICHRIWQLNSAVIEGVRIAARFTGETRPLWEQSVKVVSPARQERQRQSQKMRAQVRQTSQRKTQMKTMRAFLMSGTPLFAFIFGCVLGFSKAPVEQTNASASANKINPTPNDTAHPTGRSSTVRAALEVVPVVKHDRVADPNDPTVTLMFSGDVTLADAFADAVGKNYDQTFAHMDEYRQADLAMVNLENPLTKATLPLPGKQFNFKADPESVQVLEKGGVDLVTLANNHAMDYKEPGLLETMETLDKAGILHMGAGRDEKEARRPDIIDVKGQRVAYLSYYGADLHAAAENTAGTNYADEARISADIKSIRDQVDWIVVNFHWGEELATHPADWQIDLAHFTVDQGADLVVGHHPHVLQGAEIYKGRPIAYSLGNFIFGGNSRKDYDTAVLKVALKDKQMKVEFLPVEVRDYQPRVVTGDRAGEILRQVDDLSSSFQQPMKSPAVLDARVPVSEPLIPASPTTPESNVSPDTTTPTTPPRTYPFDPYAPAPAESSPAPTQTTPAPTDTFVPPAESTNPPVPTAPAANPSTDMGVPTTESVPPTTPGVPSPEPAIPSDMLAPSPAPADGMTAPAAPAYPGDGTTTPSMAPTYPGDGSAAPSTTPSNLNQYYTPNPSPASPTGSPTPDDQQDQAGTPTGEVEAAIPSEDTSPESDSQAGTVPGGSEVQAADPSSDGSVSIDPAGENRLSEQATPADGVRTAGPSQPSTPSNSPSDSFINSPQHTPIQVPGRSSDTLIPMQFAPSEPKLPIVTATAPSSHPRHPSPSWEQEQEQLALSQLSVTRPARSARSTQKVAESERSEAATMPNVALMAAVIW